jgi:predicted acetyltransferase
MMEFGNMMRRLLRPNGRKAETGFRFLKGFDEIRGSEFRLVLMEKMREDRLRGWVPSYRFEMLPLGGHEVLGTIDIRIGDNENTYYAGHIGYRVHEPFRGFHFAEKACRLIIRIARAHGMKEVVITCNPDNLASRRTIERLGARFESIVDIPKTNELYQYGDRQKCRFIWTVPETDEAAGPQPDTHRRPPS